MNDDIVSLPNSDFFVKRKEEVERKKDEAKEKEIARFNERFKERNVV